jgi:hypothetical protein
VSLVWPPGLLSFLLPSRNKIHDRLKHTSTTYRHLCPLQIYPKTHSYLLQLDFVLSLLITRRSFISGDQPYHHSMEGMKETLENVCCGHCCDPAKHKPLQLAAVPTCRASPRRARSEETAKGQMPFTRFSSNISESRPAGSVECV